MAYSTGIMNRRVAIMTRSTSDTGSFGRNSAGQSYAYAATVWAAVDFNRGTKASGKGVTRVGSDTLIMSYVHIAHDCRVGNHCILVSSFISMGCKDTRSY